MAQEIERGHMEEGALHITPTSKMYLSETARWAKMLAIIGFIMIGIMLILGLSIGTIMNSIGDSIPDMEELPNGSIMGTMSTFMSISYLLVAIIYFIPCYYLLKFSNQMKVALANNHQDALTSSFKNLKSLYKFMGIFALIMIGIQVIGFLIALMSGVFM